MKIETEHVTVYHRPGQYAGWPANQGMWGWGDEMLVGFVLGQHARDRANWKHGHPIDQSARQEHVYARSLDGGGTWGEPERNIKPIPSGIEAPLIDPMDFSHPDFALSFTRVTNHTGPTYFYCSCMRGRRWWGPYSFPNLGTPGVAARTDYVVLGKRELLAMLTVAKGNGREGQVLCARTADGGMTWEAMGPVSIPRNGFSIMPSTVVLDNRELLSVVRRCEPNDDGSRSHWLAAYLSRGDAGRTWKYVGMPVEDTGHGGSPAALLKLEDGRVMLAYVMRGRPKESSRLCAKMSHNGYSWGPEIVLKDDGVGWDLGYPRAVQRPDGRVVVTYYWVDRERYPDRWIGATIWKP